MSPGDESDSEPMRTEILEDICGWCQSHQSINRRDAHLKIRDRIKQRQLEWKEVLLSRQNIGKVLHKVIKAVDNDIPQVLPILDESGSEVSYLIPEPRNFEEANRLSAYINKNWLKATLKEINELSNNMTILVQYPEKSEPVTPCMDVYKSKIQSDGILDKLKVRIVVRGDLQNMESVVDTW